MGLIRQDETEAFQGQMQASAAVGTHSPVHTGSPMASMVTDPCITEEQNAWPNALFMHFPGPHSI